MGLRKEHDEDDDSYSFSDLPIEEEEDESTRSRRRHVRRMLEEKLERKRLKEEFDELDGDFDWDELER